MPLLKIYGNIHPDCMHTFGVGGIRQTKHVNFTMQFWLKKIGRKGNKHPENKYTLGIICIYIM